MTVKSIKFTDTVRKSNFVIICLGIILTILISAYISYIDTPYVNLYEIFAVVFVVVVVLFPVIRNIINKSFDVFEPVYIFGAATLISFVIAPIWIIITNRGDLIAGGVNLRGVAAKTILFSGLGLLSLYLGYYFVKKYRLQGITAPLTPTGYSNDSIANISWFTYLSTVALFILWVIWGAVPLYALNALAQDSKYLLAFELSTNNVVYLYAIRACWPGLLIILYSTSRSKFLRTVVVFLWLSTLAFYIISGNRGVVLRLVLSTLVFIYLIKHKRPALITILSFLLLFSLFAGAIVGLRSPLDSGDDATNLEQWGDGAVSDLTDAGAATGTMIITYVFPEKLDYQYFDIFGELFIAPIPRIIWPDKPILRDILTQAELVVNEAHAPAFFAPYYAGFGVAGILLSMGILGCLSGLFYANWKTSPDFFNTTLLALWLGLSWELFHRGGLVWSLVNIGYAIGPVIMLLFIYRIKVNTYRKMITA